MHEHVHARDGTCLANGDGWRQGRKKRNAPESGASVRDVKSPRSDNYRIRRGLIQANGGEGGIRYFNKIQ